MFSHVCQYYSAEFYSRKREQKFCSKDHFCLWSRGRINIKNKSVEHRKKLSNSLKGIIRGRQTIEHSRKISDARQGMKFSPEHRDSMSRSKVKFLQKGGFHGKQGKYISLKTREVNHFHSLFEHDYMKQLDTDAAVKYWSKNHKISIKYEFEGSCHRYIPDFMVEFTDGSRSLHEVKGYVFEPKRVQAKTLAAQRYCRKQGMTYQLLTKMEIYGAS